jgi:hypothetical protein
MARFKTGQLVISASAQQLRAKDATEFMQYRIKAPSTNTGHVSLGDSTVTTGTGYLLAPGDEFLYEVETNPGEAAADISLDQWYAVGAVNDKLTWLASIR